MSINIVYYVVLVILVIQFLMMWVSHQDKKDLLNLFEKGSLVRHIRENKIWKVDEVIDDVSYLTSYSDPDKKKIVVLVDSSGYPNLYHTKLWEKV